MSRMTDQVGRVLGDRYRLLAPVGRGASAQVFLAVDARLERQVAVKLLHEALADDQDFLRRFQAEARAAAALNHPHVLAVYDWGHDDEVPWIVTEYLGGGSLRGLLDRGHRLTPSQALLVGLQAAQGLEYAHARGFVHRDVKPANLLFGDDGRLRIADFGLARALAEAAMTEPQGAAVGTARYASPEQAQGRTLSGRSDVYALALVLVEAVTGSVPFAADTTLGTLMARVDRPLVVPPALGPLADVLAEAGLPDPEARPDARELVAALTATARLLPRPRPLPLAGALDAEVDDHDPTVLVGDRTAVGSATRPPATPPPPSAAPGHDDDWRPEEPATRVAAAPQHDHGGGPDRDLDDAGGWADEDGWAGDRWDEDGAGDEGWDEDDEGWDEDDEGWDDEGEEPWQAPVRRGTGGVVVLAAVLGLVALAVGMLVLDLLRGA